MTLLKNHFTLNFDLVPDLKVNYQDCDYLCQQGTKYEYDILNDISKIILIIARLGGGKTCQIFKMISFREYNKI